MKLSAHIIQGVCLAPIAYAAGGAKTAAIFAASVVLIDIDHYLHFVCRRRDFGVRNMFAFYDDLWARRAEVFGISVFHTIECIALLVAAGHWIPELRIVAVGFVAHLCADLVHLWRHGVTFVRALSFVEYFIRRKNYPPDLVW